VLLIVPRVAVTGQPEATWTEAIERVKSTVVFLGPEDAKGNPLPKATGCILTVRGVFHVLTAKHVVVEMKDGKFTDKRIDQDLLAYFNRADGTLGKRRLADIKSKLDVAWVFHEREDVDLAILPFAMNLEADDLRAIPEDLFIHAGALRELDEVFFLSYQPQIKLTDKVRPIYRGGTVSLLLPDKTLYIDGSAFPGNSGSGKFQDRCRIDCSREIL